MNKNLTIIGECPICERDMIYGPSINKHHMIPKSKGGKETEYLHKVCHQKIHSIWTEKELEREFNNAEKIKENEEIKKFIKFIRNKDLEYYDHNIIHKRRKR